MSARSALFAGLCFALAAVSPLHAQEAEIETLVVNGEQPGPGLWEFRHGEHRLWVLATVSPLPKDLKWRSKQLERVLAQSQLVIAPASVDVNIGFFKSLTLVPLALRMGNLPDKQRLADVLSPTAQARWSAARQCHAPRDDDLETLRPLFAGAQLYDKALRRAGLERRSDVWKQVRRLAKAQDVTVREPTIALTVEDPKALLREFVDTPPAADIPCFESLLTRIESQLPVMQQRGLAWAKGDVETLKRLPLEDSQAACLNVVTGTPRLAAKYEEATRRWRQEWVLAAEGALLRNVSSVAVLPLREMLAVDGLAAQLRARGYEMVEPDSK
jgi:uncharacterized protein YbaP (TraB family)